MRRPAAELGLLLLMAAACPAAHVVAQETTPPAAPAKPAPPPTLAATLDRMEWDAAKRGVLLTVAPERLRPPKDAAEAATVASGLNQVAAAYKRTVRRFGGVTAVGPAEVVAFNLRPGAPDIENEQETSDHAESLIASFTPSQWRLAGGANGIGYEALDAEQKRTFERIVPDPFSVSWQKGYEKSDRAPVVLAGEERRRIRLRVKLLTSVDARRTKEAGLMPISFNKNEMERGLERGRVKDDNQYNFERDTEFGQKLGEKVPYRLKPSDLDYAVLRGGVSLGAPAGRKAPTVGDLVTRIREGAGVELYADRRLASLPVWARGENAPAGDVLRALCYAVGGAVRRVGPDRGGASAYVLTDDREGVAARRAIVDDWKMSARAQKWGAGEENKRSRVTKNPLLYVDFDADEPVRLAPELKKRLLSPEARRGRKAIEVPITDLPVAQQAYLQKEAERLSTVAGGEYAVNPERVTISVQSWFAWHLPDGTEITGYPLVEMADLSDEPLPAPPAPPLAELSVVASAAAAETARKMVAEAARRGVRALWLRVPETPAGREALSAAVAAGQAAKLPVWAVISLLQPVPTPPGLTADVNVRGETSGAYALRRWGRRGEPNWLVPDPAETLPRRVEGITELLRDVRGLSGLVLRDVLPPGYREKSFGRWGALYGGNPSAFNDGAAAGLGHTPAMRLTFLREKGMDPADVITYSAFSRWTLPYFNYDDDAAANDWVAWRGARGTAFLEAATKVVRAAHPDLPLLLGGEVAAQATTKRDRKAAIYVAPPPDTPSPSLFPDVIRADEKKPAELARPKGGRVYLDLGGPALDGSAPPAERVGAVAEKFGPGWDGYVLDLSGMTVEQVGMVLENLAVVKKQDATPDKALRRDDPGPGGAGGLAGR